MVNALSAASGCLAMCAFCFFISACVSYSWLHYAVPDVMNPATTVTVMSLGPWVAGIANPGTFNYLACDCYPNIITVPPCNVTANKCVVQPVVANYIGWNALPIDEAILSFAGTFWPFQYAQGQPGEVSMLKAFTILPTILSFIIFLFTCVDGFKSERIEGLVAISLTLTVLTVAFSATSMAVFQSWWYIQSLNNQQSSWGIPVYITAAAGGQQALITMPHAPAVFGDGYILQVTGFSTMVVVLVLLFVEWRKGSGAAPKQGGA